MPFYDIFIEMNHDEIDENLSLLVNFLEDQKLSDIACYKVPANWIVGAVICTATSARHISSIAENLRGFRLNQYKMEISGDPKSGWIVASAYGYFIHIFIAEMREYYTLDQLWEKSRQAQ